MFWGALHYRLGLRRPRRGLLREVCWSLDLVREGQAIRMAPTQLFGWRFDRRILAPGALIFMPCCGSGHSQNRRYQLREGQVAEVDIAPGIVLAIDNVAVHLECVVGADWVSHSRANCMRPRHLGRHGADWSDREEPDAPGLDPPAQPHRRRRHVSLRRAAGDRAGSRTGRAPGVGAPVPPRQGGPPGAKIDQTFPVSRRRSPSGDIRRAICPTDRFTLGGRDQDERLSHGGLDGPRHGVGGLMTRATSDVIGRRPLSRSRFSPGRASSRDATPLGDVSGLSQVERRRGRPASQR